MVETAAIVPTGDAWLSVRRGRLAGYSGASSSGGGQLGLSDRVLHL